MAKKLLMGLAPVLVVAALVMTPAMAQASPKFYINGKLARNETRTDRQLRRDTLENHFLGKIKCQNLARGNIWNESEKGLANTEGYTTYGCTAEPTRVPGSLRRPKSRSK